MTLRKSVGASVRGPGHVSTGEPNQDAWASFRHAWGYGIVISDGLGSKQFSDIGSNAVCCAVACAANACRDKTEIDHHFLFASIKSQWLVGIAPLEPRDCAATCLFALLLGDGSMHLGLLGDGLAAVIKANGSIVQLTEDKSQGFSNITAGLSPNVTANDWRYLSLQEGECDAVLLCTDGVSDDLEDIDGFVKGFLEAHRGLAAESANRDVREMLENWPTPKHSDDKTIACLFRQEMADE